MKKKKTKSKQLTFKITRTFAQIVKTTPVQLEQYLYYQ